MKTNTINNSTTKEDTMNNNTINNATINAAQKAVEEELKHEAESKMAQFASIVGSICELTGFADIAETFANAIDKGIDHNGHIDLDSMAKTFRETLDDTIEELMENGDADSIKKAVQLKKQYIDATGNTVERFNSVPFMALSGAIYAAKHVDRWIADHKPSIKGHPVLSFTLNCLKNVAHGLVRGAGVILEAIGKAVFYGVSYVTSGITAIVAKFVEVVMAGWTMLKFTCEDIQRNEEVWA